jgi:FlaA1/EpsC-like NDP-sugar epimerase
VPRQLVKRLTTLSRYKKRSILVGFDIAAMAVALWGAFSTRLGIFYIPQSRTVLLSAGVAFVAGIAALYGLRIYHVVLRYFDTRTVTRIFLAAAISTIAWVSFVYVTKSRITIDQVTFFVPRSVAFIYCGFLFLLLFMGRYFMALLLSGVEHAGVVPDPDARKIVIYGANSAGISLADSVRSSSRYRLMAFVDSDPALKGQHVAGVPIYSPDALPRLAQLGDVDEVFLAMSKATRAERLAAIAQVRELGLEVKTVPAPEEIVSGRFTVSDIRPIDVSDLLRRDPVEPIGELIREAVEGRSILVTGAGGSIGSEICRQVLSAHPAKLVLLDHSEFALYSIHEQLLELAEKLPHIGRAELVPIVDSTLNERRIRRIIADHGIDSLFHAAAYKHVPLLEDNELVGIENLDRQGGSAEERDGGEQARRRAGRSGLCQPPRLRDPVRDRPVRERARFVGIGGPALSAADSRWRTDHRHASGDYALLHVDPGGDAARPPGERDGQTGRSLRARHGRTGENHRACASHGQSFRDDRAR